MLTECIPAQFEFPRPEGRPVVAAFNGGRITTEAGALLLGAADRVIGLTRRLAACFKDARDAPLVEHSVQALVTQRVVGIALGYEDMIVTWRVSATGAASLSRGPQPVTADPAERSLWNFALPQPPVGYSRTARELAWTFDRSTSGGHR